MDNMDGTFNYLRLNLNIQHKSTNLLFIEAHPNSFVLVQSINWFVDVLKFYYLNKQINNFIIVIRFIFLRDQVIFFWV